MSIEANNMGYRFRFFNDKAKEPPIRPTPIKITLLKNGRSGVAQFSILYQFISN